MDEICKDLLEHLIDKGLIIDYDIITCWIHNDEDEENPKSYLQLHIEYEYKYRIYLVSLKLEKDGFIFLSVNTKMNIENNYLIEYLLDLYNELKTLKCVKT